MSDLDTTVQNDLNAVTISGSDAAALTGVTAVLAAMLRADAHLAEGDLSGILTCLDPLGLPREGATAAEAWPVLEELNLRIRRAAGEHEPELVARS